MAAAAAAAASSSEIANEGPVLNLINKRLRALRKKLNRITQMEESLSQGKTLNKEQEETLRSKPSVLAGIDELEKLRQPILNALDQEIELALAENKQKTEVSTAEIENDGNSVEPEGTTANGGLSAVPDLLNLLYFASVFDVKTFLRAHENMLTRTHERNCCLTYDYVTDDDAAGDPLKEWDLDLIAMLGDLMISRPVNSSLSHKDSLEQCVEHAKLWLANADHPIQPGSNITYAGLREKLNKIMASDYYTTTPEIKAPVEVAAAAGNYTSFQVPVHGSMIPPGSIPITVEGSGAEFQQEEEQSPNSHDNEVYGEEVESVEEISQGGSAVENPSEDQAQIAHGIPGAEADQNLTDAELKEHHAGPRKPYQNYRGGRGGGGRRGYSNGRGGRGGNRGGYQNGRGQFYDQPGGYQPRNSYNYRGRGGRGMGGNFNYDGPSGNADHAQTAS